MSNKSFFKKSKNQNGQALVEFVLFLPFMLMMYSIIMNVSNAINASINQQKVTRAYFYYRMQNNSMVPKPRRGSPDPSVGWTTFGMHITGWASELYNNSVPVAACFKFNIPLGSTAEDSCKEAYNKKTTQYIRVGTVYGICGTTYKKDPTGILRLPAGGISGISTISADSCLIR